MNTTQPDLTKSQLFLDDTWIGSSLWTTRQWHQPCKFPHPVLAVDRDWERWCPALYGSVLYWRGRFRMWYCTWSMLSARRACYAESADGVTWEKPSLGVCTFQGSKDNNIVLDSMHGENGVIDCVSVIDDPGDEEWPLKMLWWDGLTGRAHHDNAIYAGRSKDGIHWDRSLGEVLPH